MNHPEKQKMFESFLSEWDYRFKNIPFILKYLASYPELVSKLNNFVPLQPEEFNRSQMEWVSLITQFDHPLDQEFFKPYWVPIQNDGYDYFIDLSTDNLVLFEIQHFFIIPYKWYKKYHFKNIAELLLSVDDPSVDIQLHQHRNHSEMLAERKQLFIERDLLGFDGKIEPIEISLRLIAGNSKESSFCLTGDTLVFFEIRPSIIGLLAGDIEITLHKIKPGYHGMKDFKSRIKNITALVYLIQSLGTVDINSYQFTFNSGIDCFAEYHNRVLTVSHNDQSLLHGFIEKYELCRNSHK